MHGFLIVTEDQGLGPYKGIDRVPAYPAECVEEEAAAEEYALGDYKSPDSNLIDSLDRTVELLKMFSSSVRKFEILYCCTEDLEYADDASGGMARYGYDVAAVTADYWSIVRDFPTCDWAYGFRTQLNKNGLFDDFTVASSFLKEYRVNHAPDADSPFEVIDVRKVLLTTI